jgi:aspartate/methionine/tyrosine aminotransferase
MSDPPPIAAFRSVPRTGVIYVTTEAQRRGFGSEPGWSNLGQGQPETGPLAGAPPRIESVAIPTDDQEYAPVAGVPELREAIADFYNQLFRRGKASQYTAENVSVSGGGRSSLTRAAASLGNVHLGHFLPDYTAYEELLDIFRMFSPTPILLDADDGYAFDVERLRREIRGRGLGAILLSNPTNPTGKLVSGPELDAWVTAARELDCALLIDEFYSHYVWRPHPSEPSPIVSAARYVEDVDKDPVIIFDGLTKNWRYPGWRVTWTVGPRAVIEAVTSAGSFLDGGGSRPLQRAAIPLLSPDLALAETAAIRRAFGAKRELLMGAARKLGMKLDREPDGTFYVWASLAGLPPALADGTAFFQAALDEKVIVVPGEFFDVNPGKRRSKHLSRFRQHVRLSFGPSEGAIRTAIERLEKLFERAG